MISDENLAGSAYLSAKGHTTTGYTASWVEGHKETSSATKPPLDVFRVECHGIKDLMEAKTMVEKVVWIVVLFLAGAGLTYGIYETGRMFLETPTVTRSQMIVTNSLPMPELRVCSFQPLNILRLLRENFTEVEVSYLHWHLNAQTFGWIGYFFELPHTPYPFEGKVSWEEMARKVAPYGGWDDFVMEFGLRCEDMVGACFYLNQPYNCCDVMVRVLHEKQGVCLYLNESVFTPANPGAGNGLVILLREPFPDTDEVMPPEAMMVPLVRGEKTLLLKSAKVLA